jgi:AAA family ATP:ADP antiporter
LDANEPNADAAERGERPIAGAALRARLLRLARAREDELPALCWSFALFFCLLSGYYVIRPVRETMGVEGGVRNLPWLFTGTLSAMLAAVPVYSFLVARLPRRRFIGAVYHFFALNLLVFWIVFQVVPAGERVQVGRVFYIWTSVFNLFVVSVFWSFLADIFNPEQAKRLFGLIAGGGTLGALCGSLATAALVGEVGNLHLLLIPPVLLEVSIYCVARLNRLAKTVAPKPSPPPEVEGAGDGRPGGRESGEPIGGSVLGGVRMILRSGYLLGICAYMFATTLCATSVYIMLLASVESHESDPAARTQLFAQINFAVQSLTFVVEFLLTGRLIALLGVGWTLCILPASYFLGFFSVATSQSLAVLVVFEVLRRTAGYAVTTPAREVLYTVVSREEKYKSKSFIDTVVFRGGDAASAWIYSHVASVLGGIGPAAAAGMPVCLLWGVVALALGRGQRRRAEALSARRLEDPDEAESGWTAASDSPGMEPRRRGGRGASRRTN